MNDEFGESADDGEGWKFWKNFNNSAIPGPNLMKKGLK